MSNYPNQLHQPDQPSQPTQPNQPNPQILLLFMRLLYYAMASDRLGSFVRMVLETTYGLLLFFLFLSVIFVGFALALVVAQGSIADIKQTFIK